jgi:dCTP deaminase
MSYLSDQELRKALAGGSLKVSPEPDDHRFQPCSIDLRLGPVLKRYDRACSSIVYAALGQRYETVDLGAEEDIAPFYCQYDTDGFLLDPGGFVLGSTLEQVSVGATLCAHVDGRSTLGRLGLMIHVTAGFVDPGFSGNITLEIFNAAPYAIRLKSGIGIGQLLVSPVCGTVERPYGTSGVKSKYGGVQEGPVPPNLRRKL